jgi:hypothetical protein
VQIKSMYTVIGTYSDGSQCEPPSYPTLAEALKKFQDLIEADVCEIAYGETEVAASACSRSTQSCRIRLPKLPRQRHRLRLYLL